MAKGLRAALTIADLGALAWTASEYWRGFWESPTVIGSFLSNPEYAHSIHIGLMTALVAALLLLQKEMTLKVIRWKARKEEDKRKEAIRLMQRYLNTYSLSYSLIIGQVLV